MKPFNFKKSLEIGKEGENTFFTRYKDKLDLVQTNGREFDFYLHNKAFELKTETRSLSETPNFFVEVISKVEDDVMGGPYQSLEKGSEYYAFYFVKDDSLFIFKTKDLVDFLDNTPYPYQVCDIPNEGWTTRGVLVPRQHLKHLIIDANKLETKNGKS